MNIFSTLFGNTDKQKLAEAIVGNSFLVDVRTPGEFSQGTVAGAVNIPLNEVSQQLNRFRNKDTIIVFCQSGNRSSQAKSILERNGLQNVINGGSLQNVKQILTEK